jgi:Cd2+/Zn2+-exporting ATPase
MRISYLNSIRFFGGIGAASKHGILFKGSNFLEALNQVEYVVLDKTGTLTKGEFIVSKIVGDKNLLELAGYAEYHSNHPIAKSIVKSFDGELDSSLLSDYFEIAGHGISVQYHGLELLAGNHKLMEKYQIDYPEVNEVGTIVYVAYDSKYIGYLLIEDEIKEESYRLVKELKSHNITHTVMLTGDRNEVAKKVAENLGISEVYSELLPHEKVEQLEKIRTKSNGKVVFVGDGINDAPVLTLADVGIAMGGVGSDAAIEACDVVIMTDEITKIASAIHLAKETRKVVWQNIIFAFGVKGIVLLLGAMGLATMWEAVFADVGVALIAVLNAMRILKK